MTPVSPLGGTQSAANAIKKVSYTHDTMIDLILGNPGISQTAIAAHFGYSRMWVSRVFNADAFRQRLAERKGDLIDPTIAQGFEENLKALAAQSLEVVASKLDATQSADMALKVLELTTKSLGYGARTQQAPAVQQTFVVALPEKAKSAEAWANAHRQAPLELVEQVVREPVAVPALPDLEALLVEAS